MANPWPIHTAKNEKICSEENIKGKADWPRAKISVGGNQRPSESSQQKSGMEMGLYQQKHCPPRPKETEKNGQKEGRLFNMCYSSRKGRDDVGDSEI